MTQFLAQYHIAGIVIGLGSFLIIGLFHPVVIKGEYYFGQKTKWGFLAGGLTMLALSLWVSDLVTSILLGVAAFSCFWGILEVKEQAKRVRKGWFPENPNRRDRKTS